LLSELLEILNIFAYDYQFIQKYMIISVKMGYSPYSNSFDVWAKKRRREGETRKSTIA